MQNRQTASANFRPPGLQNPLFRGAHGRLELGIAATNFHQRSMKASIRQIPHRNIATLGNTSPPLQLVCPPSPPFSHPRHTISVETDRDADTYENSNPPPGCQGLSPRINQVLVGGCSLPIAASGVNAVGAPSSLRNANCVEERKRCFLSCAAEPAGQRPGNGRLRVMISGN